MVSFAQWSMLIQYKDSIMESTVNCRVNGGLFNVSRGLSLKGKDCVPFLESCRDKDLAHIEEHMKAFKTKGRDVLRHIHDERSLLALQGPLAAPVLQWISMVQHVISLGQENAVDLAEAILEKSKGKVRLTGLGARDSLRLEDGLYLYGNDVEQHITPVEAGLTWATWQ
ncbi:Aminomethyltransferase [Hibiscus syriacus]|uniref:Aminomethyltransferase n=1 Tax=Hibiscus syriacus TaxID=106335 RepID=A0A6A3BFL2_HIBSY|nr:Aminomethyltransferase [Hibiscus syriacus]